MKRIPLHRPVLGPEELRAVGEVLDSGHLVQGPRVSAFEDRLGELLDAREVVAVSSGTAAIHVALLGLGCGPGDEVVVPAFGYPATANAVELCGARAVLADVDPETFAVTAETVAAVVGPRTAGILPVHAFGIPAAMETLEGLAERLGLWICEDAACALGTEQRGRWGSGRHPVCLSFHPRKTVTTAEGGAVATDDEALAARLRRLRSHGMSPDPAAGWRRFVSLGMNYRLSDVAAAIGVVQLGRLDRIVEERRRVAGLYRTALEGVAGVRLPRGYDLPELSVQSLVVVLDGRSPRDEVIAELDRRGIQTTIGGYGLAEQPYYRERYDLDPRDYPVSAELAANALTLPLSGSMDAGDVERVVGDLADVARG